MHEPRRFFLKDDHGTTAYGVVFPNEQVFVYDPKERLHMYTSLNDMQDARHIDSTDTMEWLDSGGAGILTIQSRIEQELQERILHPTDPQDETTVLLDATFGLVGAASMMGSIVREQLDTPSEDDAPIREAAAYSLNALLAICHCFGIRIDTILDEAMERGGTWRKT